MKLTTNKERAALVVAHTPDDPRCAALVSQYGAAAHMMETWSPARCTAIAAAAGHSEKAPSLVLMMRAYGTDTMAMLMQAHVTAAIIDSGLADKFAGSDYRNIAQMICESTRLRTLNMAYLLRFFAKFRRGEFELFGYTPHSFMRAFNGYAVEAADEQRRTLKDAQQRRDAEAAARHEAEAVTWEQFAKAKGIDVNENPLVQGAD